MSALIVDARNFERAETQRMFNDLQAVAGGTNVFGPLRAPTPIDARGCNAGQWRKLTGGAARSRMRT